MQNTLNQFVLLYEQAVGGVKQHKNNSDQLISTTVIEQIFFCLTTNPREIHLPRVSDVN